MRPPLCRDSLVLFFFFHSQSLQSLQLRTSSSRFLERRSVRGCQAWKATQVSPSALPFTV